MSANSIYIQQTDCGNVSLRLKEFADISISGSIGKIESIERSDNRPIVQWLPKEESCEANLYVPEGDKVNVIDGLLEDSELVVGNVYQLERVGFAMLEEISDTGVAKLVWLHS